MNPCSHLRSGFAILLAGLAWALCVPFAGAAVAWPVTLSANGRYLQDQHGTPFPILGRAAWYVLGLAPQDSERFIANSAAYGYNVLEVGALLHDPRGRRPPFDGAGDAPFTRQLDGKPWSGALRDPVSAAEVPDFSAPNQAYWSFLDALLAQCESRGIAVLLFPAYVGYGGGNEGWMREMVANGPDRMRTYGAWIAKRYRDHRNIIWMAGGDYGNFDPQQAAVEGAFLDGLRSAAGRSAQLSAEWATESVASDQPTFGALMTLNGAYSFSGKVSEMGHRAYFHTPALPAFLLEEPYDEEGPDGTGVNRYALQPVRRFQWSGWLSTIGGYVSGNGYVWPFSRLDWRAHLDTEGTRDMGRLNAFIRSIPWWELIPSTATGGKSLVTAGGGSLRGQDYVAAAANAAGSLLVAYIPPRHARTISIDLRVMRHACNARWLNPVTGAFTSIGALARTGVHTFNIPGDNGSGFADWVLVLTA